MIARGDLAVELGSVRLAEIQEEILWLCEAAHVPVIWATQVLETLAKRGALAPRNHRCRHERAGRMRDAEQGPLHSRRAATCWAISCRGCKRTSTRRSRACALCTGRAGGYLRAAAGGMAGHATDMRP